jgi:hypothetical protein
LHKKRNPRRIDGSIEIKGRNKEKCKEKHREM